MPTMSTAAGRRSSVALRTAIPGEPLKMKPNTSCWRSRIQDNPAHIQVHSWVTIQLHCSVGIVACIRVFPHQGAEVKRLVTLGFWWFAGGSASDVPIRVTGRDAP